MVNIYEVIYKLCGIAATHLKQKNRLYDDILLTILE